MDRRRFLATASAAALAATAGGAAAQDWRPTKAMRIVVPYTPGGASDITARLIADRLPAVLGPAGLEIDAVIEHPAMIAHQTAHLRRRLARKAEERERGIDRQKGCLPAEADPHAVAGVVHAPDGTALRPESIPFFLEWLRRTYGTVEALKHAWNCASSSFGVGRDWSTWEEVAEGVGRYPIREFRHLRDLLRFKADVKLDRLRKRMEDNLAADPDEPQRTVQRRR